MEKIIKILLNWKIYLPLSIAIVLLLLFAPSALRKVAPYQPPTARETSGWGTIPQETATELQSVLDADVNRLGIPGLQVAVKNSDGDTWYGVSGTVDPERHIPFGRDHILRIGSVTKTFTAVVILQLVEENRLDLDETLAYWFPDFPNAGEITLRDMLTHRSGIFEILESPTVRFSLIFPQKKWQPRELLDLAAQAAPNKTGEYKYSNTNYILLGMIAEQVTGQEVKALYRQRIIEPLGMQDSWFVPYEEAPANLISGYDRDQIPLPGIFEYKPDNVSAATIAFTAGAMVSTAEDLLKFYQGLFSNKLLSPASLEQMTTFIDASDPGTPQITGYGLGLFRLEIDGEVVWASLGQFIGFMAMVVYSPEEQDMIAVIGNLSLFDYVSVWTGLADISRADRKQ